MLLALFVGCLEKTTGEFVPLSDAYTAGHTDDRADPNKGGTGDGVWTGLKDPRLHIVGTVKSDDPSPVQIDVNIDDPAGDNGQSRVGALHLDNGPGAFEFWAPMDVTLIHLQAFQDPLVDGPSEGDPFDRADVKLAGKDPDPVELELKVGNRGQPDGGGGSAGAQANPGPGGDPNAGAPSGPNPFPGVTEFVTLSGKVGGPGSPITLDFFKVDAAGEGGRAHLFKEEVPAGDWSIRFPKDFGAIQIEAFIDVNQDGPTPGDPIIQCLCNPVNVGASDVGNLDLLLPG